MLTRKRSAAACALLSLFLSLTLLSSHSISDERPSATLLEKAIFLEEAEGELDEAISLYAQVIKEAGKNAAIAAQALYRKGNCHLAMGQTEAAKQAFKAVVEGYSSQENYRELATVALRKIENELHFIAPPWLDEEVTESHVYLLTGKLIGRDQSTIESVNQNGQDLWKLTQFLYIGSERINRVIHFSKDDFKPVKAVINSRRLGKIQATYSEDTVSLQYFKNGKATGTKNIKLAGTAYVSDQLGVISRLLPLQPGYKTRFAIFDAVTALSFDVDILVKSEQACTWGLEALKCYRVNIDISQLGNSVQQGYYLIETDGQRRVFEGDLSGLRFKASHIGAPKKEFPLAELGAVVSLTQGDDILAMHSSSKLYHHVFKFPQYDVNSDVMLFVSDTTKSSKKMRRMTATSRAADELNNNKQRRENFKQDKSLELPGKVFGVETSTLAFSYGEKGKENYEVRFYFKLKDGLYDLRSKGYLANKDMAITRLNDVLKRLNVQSQK